MTRSTPRSGRLLHTEGTKSAPKREWVGCEGETAEGQWAWSPVDERGMTGGQVQSIKICDQGKRFEFYF